MNFREYPILYVDDENANRVVMRYNLGTEFTLLIADSADAALEIMAKEFVAVLLTDQRMPEVTGVDLAEQVFRLYPDVVRVIITAYSDLEVTMDAINRAHVARFIKKPWTREELVAVIEESITTYSNNLLVKQMQAKMIELERVTSLAILSSSIAHDLRQPLAYIEPNIKIAQNDLEKLNGMSHLEDKVRQTISRVSESLQDIETGVETFKSISTSLLKSLRTKDQPKRLIKLRPVIESAAVITRSSIIRKAKFDLQLSDDEIYVMGSEGRLMQLVVNLLINAAHAIDDSQAMTNRIALRLRSEDFKAIIEVQDTGCGMTPDQKEHIFTPFFTTKGEAGSGLGLAICKQVVDEAEGTIHVDSAPEKGTCFTITLPLVTP